MEPVAAEFRELAEWATETSPLYEHVCRLVAADEDLLALAAHAPPGLERPNRFLAAVHYLLARHDDESLAAYYPSVGGSRPIDDHFDAAFRAFCRVHEEEIVGVVERRRTQTNAVRRSGALYPAFGHVAGVVDGPLALIELGCSAGLNLLWDRYRYDYDGLAVGADDSPVTIGTSLRGGDPPLPDAPPPVHSRVGVDLNPLDVTDQEDADWLQALTWPEHHDRRRVLEDAVAIARADPPRVVEGDAVEELPTLVGAVPTDVPIVVYSTLVLYQVADDVEARLRAIVDELVRDRRLHWLSGDGEDGDSDGIALEWTRAVDGEPRTTTLGAFEQHGEWLEWRA